MGSNAISSIVVENNEFVESELIEHVQSNEIEVSSLNVILIDSSQFLAILLQYLECMVLNRAGKDSSILYAYETHQINLVI